MVKQLSKRPNKKRFYKKPITETKVEAIQLTQKAQVTSIKFRFPSISRFFPEQSGETRPWAARLFPGRGSTVSSVAARIFAEPIQLTKLLSFDFWVIIGFVTGIVLMGIII